MSRCKDCIHYDICGSKKCNFMTKEADNKALDFPCSDFKNKADFADVVRCGECERRSKSADLTNTIYCPWLKKQFDKADYCSYGVKKESKNE